jgi:hypothetical protein
LYFVAKQEVEAGEEDIHEIDSIEASRESQDIIKLRLNKG